MDLLTQALQDAAEDARTTLRPPGQARARAERARTRRRVAGGVVGGLALAAVAAAVLTVPPLTHAAPPVPARSSSPTPVVSTSAPVTLTTSRSTGPTSTTTTTTTTGGGSGEPASGALARPESAPDGFRPQPWAEDDLRFGLLNVADDGLFCIAAAEFLTGDSLAQYRRTVDHRTDSDYEIVYGTVPPLCFAVDDRTRIYGRALMNPGGDPANVEAMTKKAFVRAFADRDGKSGDALWPVWYSVRGDGLAGNALLYVAEQYDPDDLRLSGH